MVCSNCKQSGHNVRTCKMKRVAEVESVDVQVESVAEAVEAVESIAETVHCSMLKDALVKAVQEHPLTTDWSALSRRFGRKEAYLKSLYNETVSAADHVRVSLDILSDEWMMELMEKEGRNCIKCRSRMYCSPKKWDGGEYCVSCHVHCFSEEISSRWKMVNEYARSSSKDKCNLCKKPATYNKEIGNGFHFDHLNMFEKSGSICSMVMTGVPLSSIYMELDVCQLLCVSCHGIVTKMERRCGFMRMKNNMTRSHKKKASEDTEEDSEYTDASECVDAPEFMEENRKQYAVFMSYVYDRLRRLLSSE
jgi:hypothetical protein